MSTTAPYRADHVGSLLRPDLVAMQEDTGLQVVTDGECRRSWWHYDFMGGLNGLDLEERAQGVQFAGIKLRPIYPIITGKLSFPG
jgi:5-methyltetrahydropteroyltriglutamate--homocysteine methyltransferase